MKCSKKLLALALSVLMICGIGVAAVYAASDAGGGNNTAPTNSDIIPTLIFQSITSALLP